MLTQDFLSAWVNWSGLSDVAAGPNAPSAEYNWVKMDPYSWPTLRGSSPKFLVTVNGLLPGPGGLEGVSAVPGNLKVRY